MPWKKVSPSHVFHVGEKIRLGGREGKIAEPRINYGEFFAIQWDSPYYDRQVIRQNSFPDLEIAVSEPTISPAAAEELKKMLAGTLVLETNPSNPPGKVQAYDWCCRVNLKIVFARIDSMVEAEEGE